MKSHIKLISTDFDGTIFAEFEDPAIPVELIGLISRLQAQGAKWVINTGRDMSSLMETLARTGIEAEPDYLVLVEREIFVHRESQYVPHSPWNSACGKEHEALFAQVHRDLPNLVSWINARFHARIYEDPFSPFCLIASNNGDMDLIHAHLNDYCKTVPHLVVVRNDVYARFSHEAYNKGSALSEVGRLLGVPPDHTFAVGDHLNDLPMLTRRYARYLAAPANAVAEVRLAVRNEGGYLSKSFQGKGVVEALKHCLDNPGL